MVRLVVLETGRDQNSIRARYNWSNRKAQVEAAFPQLENAGIFAAFRMQRKTKNSGFVCSNSLPPRHGRPALRLKYCPEGS
jgi:hypothetical protein